MEAARKMPEPMGVAVDRREVLAAFDRWRADYRFGEAPSEDALQLPRDAIEELIELRTYQYDEWYLRNHHRYRALRELDRRRARDLGRVFIAQVQLGKVLV